MSVTHGNFGPAKILVRGPKFPENLVRQTIRESVDSLCRDGADAQYMQYLSKSRITSPQTR